MKTATKKLLGILLIVTMLICTLSVTAFAAETIHPADDPLTYTVLSDGTVKVSDCESGQTDITIPGTVDGRTVSQIENGMFNGYESLESVTFEAACEIETIENAFNNCVNLKEITWSADCSLKAITKSFKGCASLTELTIPGSVQVIDKASFSNCIQLSTLTFASGSQLEEIGEEAFAYLGKDSTTVPATISSLTLPASLETLGEGAFHCIPVERFALEDGSKLKEIPDGFLAADGADGKPGTKTECTSIWDYITQWFINLTSPYPATPEQVAKACDCLVSIDLGDSNSLARIGMGSFKNQTHLTSIDFGENAVSAGLTISRGAFVAVGNNGAADDALGGIDTLVFPANLVELGDRSFDFARIQNIKFSDGCLLQAIPDGFMEIAQTGCNGYPGRNTEYAFENDPVQIAANGLETIDFGTNNSLESIGNGAFKNQSHVTSIDFGTSTRDLSIGDGAFIGVGNNAYLVENGVDATLNAGIDTLTFPANLVYLGNGSFEVARIKHLVFSDDSKLAVISRNFLGTDGRGEYNGYPGLEKVPVASNCLETIDFGTNNSLESIDRGAFKNQSHITSIDFGTSIRDLRIEDGAFIGAGNNAYLVEKGVDATLNAGIETLTFPSNLVYLGGGAFECARIKHLVFSDNCKLTKISSNFLGTDGSGSHSGYPGLGKVPVASNCLETIDFGTNNSLESIGNGAFKNQSHLTSIDFGTSSHDLSLERGAFIGIGNNVHLVENGIDSSLTGIDTLVLPANLVKIDTGVFQYANIKNIVFSDGCQLTKIPDGFLGVDGEGSNGAPGKNREGIFVKDPVQIAANSLETIVFGTDNCLESIGRGAFKNQSHITSIDFGTSTHDLSLESGAFVGVGNNAYLVENGVDSSLTGIDTLVLPANLTKMDMGAFDFSRIKHIVFSDNCKLKRIDNGFMQIGGEDGKPSTEAARVGANYLESVDFGKNNTLTEIGYGAFHYQSHLTSINFGNSENADELALMEGAFQGLSELDTLIIGSNCELTKLEGGVFSNCEKLTTVNLLNSNITAIDDSLKENANLTQIVFPKKLESITWTESDYDEKCPFYGCENVNKLKFAAADPSGYSFDDGVFQFLNESGIVYVPAETTEAEVEAYKVLLTDCGLSFDEGKWTIIPAYTVTFEMNGHGTATADQDIGIGKTAAKPANPTEAGWKFEGWYQDASFAAAFDFTAPITKDTTIYAKWTKNSILNYFTDVPADEYYHDAILWAAEKGITIGTSATAFSPNASCTRAQAVTLLWRAAGCPAPKNTEMPFTDVASDAYYYDAVLWAVENGVTHGATATTFSPNVTCTRTQAISFLWRAQNSPVDGSVNPFSDVTADDYYYDAVLWAVENGVTYGTTATTFSPAENCTRAQIVTFIWRCTK